MPDFLNKIRALKTTVEGRIEKRDHQSTSSNPGPDAKAYWKASFDPSHPVTQEWRRETGAHGWGNAELENYTDSDRNSFFRLSHDGSYCLVLKAVAEHEAFTSARLTSLVALARPQGYLLAKITAPSAKGIWPAFWLLPTEPFSWPTDGEIDVMESWNGEQVNHSCLHWGHYNGPDHDKHRVLDTRGHQVNSPEGHEYGFAWNQSSNGQGKLVWYIDGNPVMKSGIPEGIRPIAEFQIKLNIAMGGNVMQGQRPDNGEYEMIVHSLSLYDTPPGGWSKFNNDWNVTKEGHGY